QKVSEDALMALREKQLAAVRAAYSEFAAFVPETNRSIRISRKGAAGQLEQWSRQQDPWPVFKKQLAELGKQGPLLLHQHQILAKVAAQFREIRDLIRQTCQTCRQDILHIHELTEKVIQYARENIQERPGKIPVFIDELESNRESPSYSQQFSQQWANRIKDLPAEAMRVPISTRGGLIQYKEIYFDRAVRQWIDSELLPLLYEYWELAENTDNGFKMSLVNIRNRALLLSNDHNDQEHATTTPEDFTQPLSAFLQKMEGWQETLTDLDTLIRQREQEQFRLSLVFDPGQPFLPIPLQSTINQFRLNRNAWLEGVQKWWQQLRTRLRQVRLNVEQEEALSQSEKVVRFLQSRQTTDADGQYASIFLTRGYIGESFWVGRQKELDRVAKLVEQWQAGYRGALLVTGQRLSGKSLFGDTITNRFFAGVPVIRLAPAGSFSVQGRRFNTTYDLGAALEFIQKYTLHQPTVVWIDNLELWSDTNQTLAENARQLCRYIDNYARRLFFMVSMSNALRAQLRPFLPIELVFQAQINLDHMPLAEVQEAILIRHGATHKKLLNAEREEMSPQEFGRISRGIHRTVSGNIGEALNLWASGARKLSEESITYEPIPNYAFPQKIQNEAAMLLTSLILEKRTNEYHLRKLYGPAFRGKYANLVQRLLSIGLLQRDLDGWLEVNEIAVNQVGLLLERKKMLTYQR
ncbi:MAG: ATP-binding protein, partial [Lewinella sp.]|nr:ATP-binding protein [Lewinella sp.]